MDTNFSYIDIVKKDDSRKFHNAICEANGNPDGSVVGEVEVFVAFKVVQKKMNVIFPGIPFSLHQTINECTKVFMMNFHVRETPNSVVDYSFVAGYCLVEYQQRIDRKKK